jgi:hypothetical protein
VLELLERVRDLIMHWPVSNALECSEGSELYNDEDK